MDANGELQKVKERLGTLSKAMPDVSKGFGTLTAAATMEGSLSTAQKELVAVAIAISQGCEGCILYHVNSAKENGADRDALIEILGVAVEMGGGPAMVYSSKALEAFDALD